MTIDNSSPEPSPRLAGTAHAALLDPIDDAVFAFDSELNLTYANQRGAALLGGRPADLIGCAYAGACPPPLGADFAAACRQARASGRQQYLETHLADAAAGSNTVSTRPPPG